MDFLWVNYSMFTAFPPFPMCFRIISTYIFPFFGTQAKTCNVKRKIAVVIADDWGGPLGPPSHLQWHPWVLGVKTFIMILLKGPTKRPLIPTQELQWDRGAGAQFPFLQRKIQHFLALYHISLFLISYLFYSQYEIPLMEVIILILILGRLRKGMKKLSVFSENCQISFSPPCLSLSLRENERFPIPFWQISEKKQSFLPLPFVLGLHTV